MSLTSVAPLAPPAPPPVPATGVGAVLPDVAVVLLFAAFVIVVQLWLARTLGVMAARLGLGHATTWMAFAFFAPFYVAAAVLVRSLRLHLRRRRPGEPGVRGADADGHVDAP